MFTIFGSIAVAIMMLSYALETRSKWFVLLVLCCVRRDLRL